MLSKLIQTTMPADSDTTSTPPLPDLPALREQLRAQERVRLARDLHDQLGGDLTAIKMALSRLGAQLPPQAPQLQATAAYLEQLVERSFDTVQRLTSTLRQAPAPELADGMLAALKWQVQQFELQTGVEVALACPAHAPELDATHRRALFHIVQEALSNIARHAGASQVSITLECDHQCLQLTISDNGEGLRQQDRDKPGHFGLRGIEERITELGGSLHLSGAPGSGTILALTLELTRAARLLSAEDQGTA